MYRIPKIEVPLLTLFDLMSTTQQDPLVVETLTKVQIEDGIYLYDGDFLKRNKARLYAAMARGLMGVDDPYRGYRLLVCQPYVLHMHHNVAHDDFAFRLTIKDDRGNSRQQGAADTYA